MSSERRTMKHLTIANLESLTGFTFRTIKKRLAKLNPSVVDGPRAYYDSELALQALYEDKNKGGLSLDQERAKLAKVQTKKMELEYKMLKHELVPAEEFIEEYSKRVVATKNKFLGIPSKLGARFRSFGEAADLEEEAEELIHEALREMAVADASA